MNAESPRPRHVPERSCVGCGQKKPKDALIRLVVGPDGQVSVDRRGTAPGRGAFLCGPACMKAAVKRRAFQRAFRGKAAPFDPAQLASAIEGVGLQGGQIGLHAAPRREAERREG